MDLEKRLKISVDNQKIKLAKTIATQLSSEDPVKVNLGFQALRNLKRNWHHDEKSWKALEDITNSHFSEGTKTVKLWFLAIAAGLHQASATQLRALRDYARMIGAYVEVKHEIHEHRHELTEADADKLIMAMAKEMSNPSYSVVESKPSNPTNGEVIDIPVEIDKPGS